MESNSQAFTHQEYLSVSTKSLDYHMLFFSPPTQNKNNVAPARQSKASHEDYHLSPYVSPNAPALNYSAPVNIYQTLFSPRLSAPPPPPPLFHPQVSTTPPTLPSGLPSGQMWLSDNPGRATSRRRSSPGIFLATYRTTILPYLGLLHTDTALTTYPRHGRR